MSSVHPQGGWVDFPGLHVTQATRKGDRYTGKGVHEAARVGAQAGAGEVLASKEILDAAIVCFPISEVRTVKLKGVKQPKEVAVIEEPLP